MAAASEFAAVPQFGAGSESYQQSKQLTGLPDGSSIVGMTGSVSGASGYKMSETTSYQQGPVTTTTTSEVRQYSPSGAAYTTSGYTTTGASGYPSGNAIGYNAGSTSYQAGGAGYTSGGATNYTSSGTSYGGNAGYSTVSGTGYTTTGGTTAVPTRTYSGAGNTLASRILTAGGSATGATTSYSQQQTYTQSSQYGRQQSGLQYGGASSSYVSGAYRGASGATETSRVVGHEYGQERVVSVQQRVDETRTRVVGERYIEHEVRVPKRIVREEVIEKVIVVPERIVNEEVIEEVQKVKERIIEVAKPIIVEKIVEVPEIEYVERIVEVPEKIVQEKVREVEKIIQQERINEVIKVIPQERIVEIPDIQYREVPFERVVEIPDIREEVIIKEVPVPQYVDKPVPQTVTVDNFIDMERKIPIAVEADVCYEYRLPRIKPRYNKVTYPVYLPRFIEIPVAVELLNSGLLAQAESYLAQVGMLTKTAASLCEIENLATTIMRSEIQSQLSGVDLQSAIMKAWQTGVLQQTTTTTTRTTGSMLH